ncbi:MAG: CDP-diacylglycerol--glycerol-3-phosphate 3-phosphatidyltransferase [Clostridia bacterium]|nr:CDP-diacylglycerol--glycerol-3-phosphate 3-phosphatidyltransferase [Clostridia bacterium]
MNTANKITLLRVVLVPIFMFFLMKNNYTCQLIALAIFLFAAATDGVDGYIARKYNQITTFGKFVDPLADKMLTTSALVVLLYYGRVSPWAVVIILAREFIVMGVRLVAGAEGKVIAASFWGKLKTVTQMVAVIAAIVLLGGGFSPVPAKLITDILIWLSVVITVFSGVDYLVKNWSLMDLKGADQ